MNYINEKTIFTYKTLNPDTGFFPATEEMKIILNILNPETQMETLSEIESKEERIEAVTIACKLVSQLLEFYMIKDEVLFEELKEHMSVHNAKKIMETSDKLASNILSLKEAERNAN